MKKKNLIRVAVLLSALVFVMPMRPVAVFAEEGTLQGSILLQPPSGDATALIQAALDAAAGIRGVRLTCGNWTVSAKISFPTMGGALSGEAPGCVKIAFSAATPAFEASSISAPVSISNLAITGTAGNFNGAPSSIADTGQEAVHLYNASNVVIDHVDARNLSGAAFDCEHPASAFNAPSSIRFSHLMAANTYRAFYAHNSCEYASFSDVEARNNVWGAFVASGNVVFADFLFVYNYNNIDIRGQSNANPCHGVFANGTSNHGVGFNLNITSCGVGETFSGVDFIGDGSGSLTGGGGEILVRNSRGVVITGCHLGSNVTVSQTDPGYGTAQYGANQMLGMYVRDDIAGFKNPVVDYRCGLSLKNNIGGAGSWSQNNAC
jgi:hypothetical protein